MNETKSILSRAIQSSLLVLANTKINDICSKVNGRENYIIHLYNGKVDFYGTKKQFLESPYSGWVYLKDAYKYNTFKFTYKKDWIETLKKLEVKGV